PTGDLRQSGTYQSTVRGEEHRAWFDGGDLDGGAVCELAAVGGREGGYDVDGACTLCRAPVDCLHRVDDRDRAVAQGVIRRGGMTHRHLQRALSEDRLGEHG